jgi:photosystem II stability/assembly factor-like uncharacterized protein
MPEGHFAGLREYTDDTARQPDFEVIRRRAGRVRRRRRNAVASVVAGLTAAVVVATGLTTGPGDGGQPAATPTPTPSADANAGWPRWTQVVAARSDELYALYERCRTCDAELHVSADGGRTWSRRTVPPSPTVSGDPDARPGGMIDALAPGVLVWLDPSTVAMTISEPAGSASGGPTGRPLTVDIPPPAERYWITRDGGRSWARPGVDEQPVNNAPAGTRVVDCGAVKVETPCRLYAVDPATGRFAPLANQPTGIRYTQGWLGYQTDVPVDGRLWVPGLDPVTRKPAVAASPDGGRTWTTHVFTDGVPADESSGFVATMYLPTIAAGAGATAYVLTYKAGRHDPYRTTDGGATWERLPGGPIAEVPDAGYVTADGAHVVKNGSDFRAFRPGAAGYTPATLAGYPADLRRLTQVTSQQATGRYVVTSGEILSVSDDGWTWRRIGAP